MSKDQIWKYGKNKKTGSVFKNKLKNPLRCYLIATDNSLIFTGLIVEEKIPGRIKKKNHAMIPAQLYGKTVGPVCIISHMFPYFLMILNPFEALKKISNRS